MDIPSTAKMLHFIFFIAMLLFARFFTRIARPYSYGFKLAVCILAGGYYFIILIGALPGILRILWQAPLIHLGLFFVIYNLVSYITDCIYCGEMGQEPQEPRLWLRNWFWRPYKVAVEMQAAAERERASGDEKASKSEHTSKGEEGLRPRLF